MLVLALHIIIIGKHVIYMLFAGWEVRVVKNCDRGQHFQVQGKN